MAQPAPTPEDDAFAQRLYDRTFRKQVRIASKPIVPGFLRGEHRELIDEALARAYKGRETFSGETDEDLLRWVLGILRNHIRDTIEARERLPREVPLPVDDVVPDPASTDPAEAASDAETSEEDEHVPLPSAIRQLVATAQGLLKTLSKGDYEILLLRLGNGLSIREIAARLDLEEGAVKMRYRRAFERLRALAQKAGIEPGGPVAGARKRRRQGGAAE